MEDRVRDRDLSSACADCLSRRKFLGQSALAAATAAFLAACGDGQIGPDSIANPAGPVTVKVADFAGLATVGTLVDIDFNVSAKRAGSATFAAFSRRCPHEGFQINLEGTGFHCFSHDSRFDNDGNLVQGPATRGLDRLPTTYDPTTDTLTIG
jgi:Rieske Fe-S protein